MRPEQLRHLLRIEKPVPGNDLDGVPEDAWKLVAEVWGKIRPLRGNEYEQSQQMQSSVTHMITTWYRLGADNTMRLVHGKRIFNVESVINVDERNFWLEWRCAEEESYGYSRG